MQGGAHAAQNVLRAVRGEPLQPFRYRDYGNMATIGRGSAVADIGPREGSPGSSPGSSGCFIHIFWLIGFRNRLAVMSRVGVGLCDDAAARAAHHRRAPLAGVWSLALRFTRSAT